VEGYEGVAVVSEGCPAGVPPPNGGNYVLLVEGGWVHPPTAGYCSGPP